MKNIKVRKEVLRFAEQMEKKLKKNDRKGGWLDEDYEYLMTCLEEEVEELRTLLDKGGFYYLTKRQRNRIIGEAADVANFAMMIADNIKDDGNAGEDENMTCKGE